MANKKINDWFKHFAAFVEENSMTAEVTGADEALREIRRLRRVDKDYQEALTMIETLAAAGARITALLHGKEPELQGVLFHSKDGMFSEELVGQRIKALLKKEM
jgi:hypothetical protein